MSKSSEIKGSNFFICILNLELHFTKFYNLVNSKNKILFRAMSKDLLLPHNFLESY